MEKARKSVSEKNMGQQVATAAKTFLYLRLKEDDSVQEHIKAMTEIFEGLSVIGDPISDENCVVHLLASLPESYNVNWLLPLKRMRLCVGWKLLLSVYCMKKEN